MIFWISVICIWHAEMIPGFFNEKDMVNKPQLISEDTSSSALSFLIDEQSTRELTKKRSLTNRSIYSRQSFLISNFYPV